MATFTKKVMISLSSTLLYLITSSPLFFMEDNLFQIKYGGLMIFSLISYMTMGSQFSSGIKLKHTVYAALLYFFILTLIQELSSQYNILKNNDIISIVLGSILYFSGLIGLMYLPD